MIALGRAGRLDAGWQFTQIEVMQSVGKKGNGETPCSNVPLVASRSSRLSPKSEERDRATACRLFCIILFLIVSRCLLHNYWSQIAPITLKEFANDAVIRVELLPETTCLRLYCSCRQLQWDSTFRLSRLPRNPSVMTEF